MPFNDSTFPPYAFSVDYVARLADEFHEKKFKNGCEEVSWVSSTMKLNSNSPWIFQDQRPGGIFEIASFSAPFSLV